jgi:hypothetical protein
MSAIEEFIHVILKGNGSVYRLWVSCAVCGMYLVQILLETFFCMIFCNMMLYSLVSRYQYFGGTF